MSGPLGIEGVLDTASSVLWSGGKWVVGSLAVVSLAEFVARKVGTTLVGGIVRSVADRTKGVPVLGPLFSGLRSDAAKRSADTLEDIREILDSEAVEQLDEQGFEVLDAETFERADCDPAECWRRPFTFAEIEAGYAIDRTDADGTNVTEDLLSKLEGGTQQVVLGPPGAGKTTISKSVAWRWHDDEMGHVLYRKRGRGRPLRDTELLSDAIEEMKADGPVLVVVEDAVRSDSIPIFEVVHEYATDSEVSFLLDSRETEWETERFQEVARQYDGLDLQSDYGQQVLNTKGSAIEEYHAPNLTEAEVERVVETFEEHTDKTVRADAAEIFEQVQSESKTSRMLLLSYHLPVGNVEMNEDGNAKSALQANVREVYNRVTTRAGEFGAETPEDETLLARVALLINVLNATEIGVYEELVHALAEDERDHRKIDRFLSESRGLLVFGTEEGSRYWANHERWSSLYLAEHADPDSMNTARKEFEACVNALFGVVDDADQRERIRRHFGSEMAELERIEEDAESVADSFVETVFVLGIEMPKLAPLFGTTEFSGIEVPECCSDATAVQCPYWRAWMYKNAGMLDGAADELDVFAERLEDCAFDSKQYEARYYNQRGLVAKKQGAYGDAREYYEESLAIYREIGNRRGRATSLNNLGMVAEAEGAYEDARDYYEESLAIKREIGNRRGRATTLNNLGSVAGAEGAYEDAREYYEESLAIYRERGVRRGWATNLNDLGLIAHGQGRYEDAREYYEGSLAIYREIGDRGGLATSLNNLGGVAEAEGAYEEAREYYEESLGIYREIGDRSGRAVTLNNLGMLAYKIGVYHDARKCLKQSLKLCREVGAVPDTLESLFNLTLVCEALDETDTAREYCREAIDLIDDADISSVEDEREKFENRLAELDEAEA